MTASGARPAAPGAAAPHRQHASAGRPAAAAGRRRSSRSSPASDALLLAPTAGGKTEAAIFPLLSADGRRALAGHCRCSTSARSGAAQQPAPAPRALRRLARAAGRRCGTATSAPPARRAILRDRPDILLTTPESLEAMLVAPTSTTARSSPTCAPSSSTRCTPSPATTAAGTCSPCSSGSPSSAGRPLQRIGLSATVGNPDELLTWLQGSGAGQPAGDRRRARHRRPVARPAAGRHRARLRRLARQRRDRHRRAAPRREAAGVLRVPADRRGARRSCCASRGVTTFLSHASLSADERRRAEQAFAEARDCVIVATTTLELGIDVGDLDRVIQIDAPAHRRVVPAAARPHRPASRHDPQLPVPRPGRRSLLQAAGAADAVGHAAGSSRSSPPPEPRHIVAQQLLALCLQEHRVGDQTVAGVVERPRPVRHRSAEPIVRYLVENGLPRHRRRHAVHRPRGRAALRPTGTSWT